jgi:hypothetical protein
MQGGRSGQCSYPRTLDSESAHLPTQSMKYPHQTQEPRANGKKSFGSVVSAGTLEYALKLSNDNDIRINRSLSIELPSLPLVPNGLSVYNCTQ